MAHFNYPSTQAIPAPFTDTIHCYRDAEPTFTLFVVLLRRCRLIATGATMEKQLKKLEFFQAAVGCMESARGR